MRKNIDKIRKCLTTLELEESTRHPETPNYRTMLREAEEAEYEIQRIKRLIKDFGDI